MRIPFSDNVKKIKKHQGRLGIKGTKKRPLLDRPRSFWFRAGRLATMRTALSPNKLYRFVRYSMHPMR